MGLRFHLFGFGAETTPNMLYPERRDFEREQTLNRPFPTRTLSKISHVNVTFISNRLTPTYDDTAPGLEGGTRTVKTIGREPVLLISYPPFLSGTEGSDRRRYLSLRAV